MPNESRMIAEGLVAVVAAEGLAAERLVAAAANSGCPVVLIAYGEHDAERLYDASVEKGPLPGAFVDRWYGASVITS